MYFYRSIFLILLFLVIIVNCTRIVESEVAKKEVNNVLENYYHAKENSNIDALISYFKKDSNLVCFFPNRIENVTGNNGIQSYYENIFSKYKKIKTWRKNEKIELSQLGKIAIVTSINHSEMKLSDDLVSVNYFNSIVLEKIQGTWLIVHLHVSIINNDLEDEITKDQTSENKDDEIISKPFTLENDNQQEEKIVHDTQVKKEIIKEKVEPKEVFIEQPTIDTTITAPDTSRTDSTDY